VNREILTKETCICEETEMNELEKSAIFSLKKVFYLTFLNCLKWNSAQRIYDILIHVASLSNKRIIFLYKSVLVIFSSLCIFLHGTTKHIFWINEFHNFQSFQLEFGLLPVARKELFIADLQTFLFLPHCNIYFWKLRFLHCFVLSERQTFSNGGRWGGGGGGGGGKGMEDDITFLM
jgi:hypothetical protein